MNSQLTQRDSEQLSAYLDNALSERARVQFEDRLGREPELAAVLQQLQRTRALLKRAPQRRVPRPFTLTPELLGRAAGRPGGWSALNFASAVASILLALVLIGDFSINGIPPFGLGAAAPAADEAPQALMAEAADQATEETLEPIAEDAFGERQGKEEAQVDLRTLFAQNARAIEIGLAAVILLTATAAWVQKRNK